MRACTLLQIGGADCVEREELPLRRKASCENAQVQEPGLPVAPERRDNGVFNDRRSSGPV
jgi:hypothetical protein